MNPDCEAQRTTGDPSELQEFPEGWRDVDVLLEVSKRLDEIAAALHPDDPEEPLGILKEPVVDMLGRLATIVRIERFRHHADLLRTEPSGEAPRYNIYRDGVLVSGNARPDEGLAPVGYSLRTVGESRPTAPVEEREP